MTWMLIPLGHHQIFSLQKKRLQKVEETNKKMQEKKNTHSLTLSISILKKKHSF